MARPASRSDPSQELRALRRAAADCRACPLWERGTQTVFGAGDPRARLVLVGEQPGDEEDLEGEPFIGAAGRLLDRALADAGVDRQRTYVTNAVKHFKWQPRGKRRIHQKPNRTEVVACHRWLDAELAVLPEGAPLVALGATAGQALFGPSFRVGAARGGVLDLQGRPVVATVHPSAVLRARGRPDGEALYHGLVDDLGRAWRLTT